MGPIAAAEIDAWLRGGGLVVTASERAARALAAAFHRARRSEGFTAWPAPNILDWNRFLRTAWKDHSLDSRLLLNPMQEQSLWAGIASTSEHTATLLEGPRHRLAGLAMDAHDLLCAYAPRLLRASIRAAWQQDAAAFSGWLTAFDDACRDGNLLSSSRLPLELIPLLNTNPVARPPLLLAGFDRILPTQRSLLDAWGAWRKAAPDEPASQIHFHDSSDAQAELAACALWCRSRLAANPHAQLLVITQDATKRRGEIERAFLQYTGSAAPPLFEFSLGVPLTQIALTHSAHLLLRWLSGPLAEHELDWLLSSGYASASPQESSALQAAMRKLRSHNRQQPDWALAALIHQPLQNLLPSVWVQRMTEAQRRLADFARRPQNSLDWAELIPHLLETAGWPGSRPLSSAEFQAARRWRQTVDSCASLGFDGCRLPWQEFLSVLAHALDETLFAPESRDAPIQIAGPAESAGLTADAVWFLGVDEDAWPVRGSTHPLIPPEVQREAGMPHATPQLDWDLAQAITARLLASAPEVHFSFARQREGIETRPSRLVAQLAGPPQPLPQELVVPTIPDPLTEDFEDASRIPFVAVATKVEGGSSVLTSQSQCPFKAFVTARLGAQSWEPAQAGLTASQRGILLHAVLHAVWAGPTDGIRSQVDLQKRKDLDLFVATHVHRIFRDELHPQLRERLPRRYLELEEQRLTALVTEWLDYEVARLPFTVAETEAKRTVHLAGLTFDLRLDRIDRLNDGSLLVIDYKSGDVSPNSWELPRPDDVQLPLYAGFALDSQKEELGGLVFAKVRAGKPEFAGHLRDARTTLIANLSRNRNLVKKPLSDELLDDWKDHIEQLAIDFLAGRAEVDPRDYPKTCKHCGLQTLCRIQEHQAQLNPEDDSEGKEAVSE